MNSSKTNIRSLGKIRRVRATRLEALLRVFGITGEHRVESRPPVLLFPGDAEITIRDEHEATGGRQGAVYGDDFVMIYDGNERRSYSRGAF